MDRPAMNAHPGIDARMDLPFAVRRFVSTLCRLDLNLDPKWPYMDWFAWELKVVRDDGWEPEEGHVLC